MLKKPFILPGTILLTLLIIWLLIRTYAPLALTNLQNNSSPSLPTNNSEFTLAEVNTHTTSTDCWTIIENKVYNLTSFINQHPGGEKIIEACGIDATNLFKVQFPHDPQAETILQNYFIGNLK